ncbi:hypothetical protein OKW24_005728 [Peribacillus simplex]|uniref:hypothetical protein n=1 Tax=Peribacillus simplex TaxID=1478 RepID=UPI0024E1F7C6|nr:hypothetical protein [Peribacillus simplex]MDF9763832.1 hypothetical protein [Peribacillus simplex]
MLGKKRNSSEQKAKKKQNEKDKISQGWYGFQMLSTHLPGLFQGLCWCVVFLLLASLLVHVWFGPMEMATVVELAKSYLGK